MSSSFIDNHRKDSTLQHSDMHFEALSEDVVGNDAAESSSSVTNAGSTMMIIPSRRRKLSSSLGIDDNSTAIQYSDASTNDGNRFGVNPSGCDANSGGSAMQMEVDSGGNDDLHLTKRRRITITGPEQADLPPARLAAMIPRLDDELVPGEPVENVLESLCAALEPSLDLYEPDMVNILYECVAFLPEKLTVFSALVAMLNSRSSAFGISLIARLISGLNSCFAVKEQGQDSGTVTKKEDRFDIAVRIVTFLCDLGNTGMVNSHSIVATLNQFLDVAERHCSCHSSSPSISTISGQQLHGCQGCSKSDYFLWLVLHTLPWIGGELAHKMTAQLEQLLDRIQAMLASRTKTHLRMLQVWSTGPSTSGEDGPQKMSSSQQQRHNSQQQQIVVHHQLDYLDSLWDQLDQLRHRGGPDKVDGPLGPGCWHNRHIVRPFAAQPDDLFKISEDSPGTPGEAYNLDGIDFASIRVSSGHPLPRVVFRLFDQDDCPDDDDQPPLPPSGSIERFLVEEDLNWIINCNFTDWRLCAKKLLAYYRRHTVPLSYIVIEVVFGQMFQLPRSHHLELFYGTLMIELCRLEPSSIPQVLAQAAELLYQRVDTMQPICIDRFVDWFSYHLSNFEYRWSWADWADCVTLDSLHPRRIFVREVIEKCLRLSYRDNIVRLLPPVFEPMIPVDPSIIYVLDDESHPAYAKAQQFKRMLVTKCSGPELLEALQIMYDDDGSVRRQLEEQKLQQQQKQKRKNSSDDLDADEIVLDEEEEEEETNDSNVEEGGGRALQQQEQQLSPDNNDDDDGSTSMENNGGRQGEKQQQQQQQPAVNGGLDGGSCSGACEAAKSGPDAAALLPVGGGDTTATIVPSGRPRPVQYSLEGIAVFTAVLLKASSQTISHTFAGLAKHHNALVALTANATNEDAQSTILRTLHDAWLPHKQMLTLAVDKLLRMGVLDPGIVLAWVFCDHMKREFKRSWVWDVLNSALAKLKRDHSLDGPASSEDALRGAFLTICHKFTLIITEHLVNCEVDGVIDQVEDDFYNYTTGRLRYVFLKHYDIIGGKSTDPVRPELTAAPLKRIVDDLDRELFSLPTIGARVRSLFDEFRALVR